MKSRQSANAFYRPRSAASHWPDAEIQPVLTNFHGCFCIRAELSWKTEWFFSWSKYNLCLAMSCVPFTPGMNTDVKSTYCVHCVALTYTWPATLCIREVKMSMNFLHVFPSSSGPPGAFKSTWTVTQRVCPQGGWKGILLDNLLDYLVAWWLQWLAHFSGHVDCDRLLEST